MRLLRRKKGEDEGQDPAGPDPQGNGAAGADVASTAPDEPESPEVAAASANDEDAGVGDEEGPVDPALAILEEDEGERAAPAAEPVAAAPPPPDGDEDGYAEERLPASFYFDGLLKNERPPSREELDRQAEAEFHAAIAPSVGPLHEIVPDAASPEDALQKLTETWEEPLPDPEGEAARGQDPYKRGPADTAVYYRIRRHFDSPRRHVGFGREAWRPPAGLAGEPTPRRGRSRQALPSGQRSRRS